MTLGSAASVHGRRPGTPLPTPATAGPSCGTMMKPPHARPARAADDPPRGRILVVEDDAVIALSLQRLLREAGYCVVGPATSAQEAERLIHRGPVDCAVLRTNLSSADALAIADLLDDGGVPLVFLTSSPLDALPLRHTRQPVVSNLDELLPAIQQAISAEDSRNIAYPIAPPQSAWPRVWPSL